MSNPQAGTRRLWENFYRRRGDKLYTYMFYTLIREVHVCLLTYVQESQYQPQQFQVSGYNDHKLGKLSNFIVTFGGDKEDNLIRFCAEMEIRDWFNKNKSKASRSRHDANTTYATRRCSHKCLFSLSHLTYTRVATHGGVRHSTAG